MNCFTEMIKVIYSTHTQTPTNDPDEIETIHHIDDDYDIESNVSKSQDRLQSKLIKQVSLIIVALVSLLFLGMCLIYINRDTTVEVDYLKETPHFNEGLSARMLGHHVHRLRCNDFEYGCCAVNFTMYGRVHSRIISPYRTVKYNPEGSNCPTIKSMIDKYNHIFKDECSQTKVGNESGCCLIEDHPIHIVNDGYCPSSIDLIHMYERNYYDSTGDVLFILGLLCLGITIAFCTKK